MSKLFIDEPSLMFSPTLASKIGLSKAIIIQQIHYWLEINKEANRNFHDGYYWTFNSYPEWQKQFPFWNISTVKRIFLELEKEGYIISSNYNKIGIDRTKWYRLNYNVLQSPIYQPLSQNETTIVLKSDEQQVNLTPPIPETNSETTAEIRNKEIYKGFPLDEIKPLSFFDYFELYGYKNEDIVKAVGYYVQRYREYIGKEHPNLKPEQWERVEDYIMSFEGEYSSDDINLEEIEQIIDKHFITEYADGCDYNILHFVSGDIIKNRFYEECY